MPEVHFVVFMLAQILRIAVVSVCLYSMIVLLIRFKRNSANWNIKTKDYWYSLLMWSFSGLVLAIQGMLEGRIFTPTIIAAAAAAFVTGKGLHRKGAWGSDR